MVRARARAIAKTTRPRAVRGRVTWDDDDAGVVAPFGLEVPAEFDVMFEPSIPTHGNL